MGSHRFSLGVHIEGIGELGGTASDGTLFVSRQDPAYDGPWSVALWSAIDEIPDVLRDRLDIWQSDYRTSAAEIGLALDSEAKLPQALMPQSWQDNHAEVVVDDGSTIEVAPVGVVNEGDRLFCGTETIRFDSQGSVGAESETWDVTRGMHLTDQITHFPGQYLYQRPPNLVERPMRIVLIEGGEASSVFWTGLIANWKTNPGHTKLEVKARALHQAFRQQKLNSRARPIGHTGDAVNPTQQYRQDWQLTAPADYPWIYSDEYPGYTPQTAIQVGQKPYNCTIEGLAPGGDVTIVPGGWLFPADEVPARSSDEDRLAESEKIWQIFPVTDNFNIFNAQVAGFLSENLGRMNDHVLMQAACLITSTGSYSNHLAPSTGPELFTDVFGPDWGMGMPATLLDADAWSETIRRYPNDTVDQYVWGWNGQTVDVWQEIKAWCRAYNYVIVPNDEGKLQPVKISDLEITDAAEVAGQSAYLTAADAPIDAKSEEAIVQVSADYGGLPWVSPSKESVKVEGRRRMSLLRSAEATLDLTWLSRANEAKVRQLIEDHMDKRAEHPPELTAIVTNRHYDAEGVLAGECPPLAQWVQIRGGPERGLLGPSGDFVDPESDQVTFTGIVVSRELNTEEHLIEATVLLWMWGADIPSRLVAPGAEVMTDPNAGVPAATDGVGDWIAFDADKLTAYDETSGLMVGDDIVIERPDGLGRPQTAEIEQVLDPGAQGGFGRIYVDSHPIPPSDIQPGDLIRLADEQDFANTTWNGADYWSDPDIADRRYCYIVGPSGTFTSGEPPDTYTGV